MQAEGKTYFLGCSGYFYRDWKGRFYPEELKPSGWFRYYAERFNTVELNSTFYHFPRRASLRRLYRESPADFRISVKVNRLVTHRKRFRDTEEIVRGFYEVVSDALGEKLGCLLFQLPPSYRYSKESLERILSQLDGSFRNVLEFRHRSWWRGEVYSRLREEGVIFCSVSAPELPEDLVDTAGILYIRFHGREGWYRYSYTEKELGEWADKIRSSPAKLVYAYFNNDYNAHAVENCRTLRELLGASSQTSMA